MWQQSNGWVNEYSLEEFLDANPLEWININFHLNSECPDTVATDARVTRLASLL